MSQINLMLPAKLKAQIQQRVESGEYGSAEQYVSELLRRDRLRERQRAMEAMLLKRLDKSLAVEMDSTDFARIRRRVQRRLRRAG